MKLLNKNQNRDEHYQKMTQTSEKKLVIGFAIPAISVMVVTSLYNMINAYFVGQLGTHEVAAVQFVFPIMIVIQAFGLFFGQGAGNYISREMGAKNFEKVSKMASTAFYLTLAFGVLFLVLGWLFLEPFSRILGADELTLAHTMNYLRFILLCTPFMASTVLLNIILRFQGYAVVGMVGVLLGAVLNAILDPILIIGFGLGVSGASLATFISQLISFAVLYIGCMKAGGVKLKLKDFSLSGYYMKEITKGGAPSLIKQLLTAVASLMMNRIAEGYGISAVAAISVVQRLTIFTSSVISGLGQGLQPVCGFNYGAKLYGRVKSSFTFTIKLASAFMLLTATVFSIFAPQIVRFLIDDPEVVQIGSLMLRLQCITFVMISPVSIGSMFMQTLGKPVQASLLAVARQGLVFIPVLMICTQFGELLGLQLTQPISDALSFALSIPLIMTVFKNMGNKPEDIK